jgi:hypothetical protein
MVSTVCRKLRESLRIQPMAVIKARLPYDRVSFASPRRRKPSVSRICRRSRRALGNRTLSLSGRNGPGIIVPPAVVARVLIDVDNIGPLASNRDTLYKAGLAAAQRLAQGVVFSLQSGKLLGVPR